MRRLVGAVLGALCVTVLTSITAAADQSQSAGTSVQPQPPGVCDRTGDRVTADGATEVVCRSESHTAEPGVYRPPRPRARSAAIKQPLPDIVRLPEIANVPPVGLCHRPGPLTISRAELALPENDQARIWMRVLNNLPRCPAIRVDPVDVAVAVLERVPLPAPAPHIAPGWAITGKLGFLEPNLPVPIVAGKPTLTDTRATELGDMSLTATAVYRVDWGDAETGPHAGPGGPWPGGNISHSWADMGTYDVVVTAEWTVDWRMGATFGRLTTTTQGTIADFRVEQLQAVRNH